MKRIYVTPETFVVQLMHREMLLSISDIESTRNVGGGPTNPEDGGKILPTVVGETDGSIDPFSDNTGKGRGQGSNGAGNRAKSFDAWEDW